ncbi:MAG TPA: PDZ domain-containing protein [Abditibacteriaceae bacterium]
MKSRPLWLLCATGAFLLSGVWHASAQDATEGATASASVGIDKAANAQAANAQAANATRQNLQTNAASSAAIQQIVDQVKPALVRIQVVESSPQAGREVKAETFGSGVIISPDGYVVTNHHVAGDAKWLSVTLSSRERVDAKLVGTDALSDLAIIKLEPTPDGQPYPTAQWGDSSTLRVGEAVLAMGSPFAFSQSVTAGIISNTELVMPKSDDFTLDGENVGSIVRWIGHDAPIHPGNSGGPLVNLRGEIIGINEIEMGLSGAIPGNLAREVSAQIISHGRVLRSYTGLDLQPRLRGDNNAGGVLVSGVVPNSPAARAGIKAGDVLLSAGDAALDAKFPEQLPLVNLELSRLPLDRPTTLTLLRNRSETKIDIAARQRDAVYMPSQELKNLGVTAMDITAPLALEWKYPNTDGVVVTTIQEGSPAAEAKPAIQEGDVILAVRNQPVKSLAALRKMLDGITRREGGTQTLIELRRRGERMLCVTSVNPERTEDASVEVAKAYLPVSTQVVTQELAQALGLPAGTQGVRITQVHPGSAATAAGLKVGDIITKLDDLEVEASQAEDTDVFNTMIRQYKIGSWARIALLRHEANVWKPKLIGVKLPRAPKQERELASYRDDNFGITLRSVTYIDRLRKEADPDEDGALVTAVDEGSWAALAGLAEADIIRSIDGVPVKDMESARARLRDLEKARSRRSVFFVSRGVHTLFVELQTDWSLPPAPVVKTAQTTPK